MVGDYPVQLECSNSAGDTALLPVTVTIYDPAEYSKQPKINLKKYILYTRKGKKPDLRKNIETAEWHGIDMADAVRIDDTQVKYKKPGTYEVSYHLEDEEGNEGIVRLILVVTDKKGS